MKRAGSVVWSANVDPTRITYSWSADATKLTCVYTPGWPANSEVTWEVDPGQFTGADGTQLVAPMSGSFQTAAKSGSGGTTPCNQTAPDPNQGSYTVAKAMQYVQNDPTHMVPSADSAAAFNTILVASPKNKISSVFLVLPDGTRQEMLGYLAQTFVLGANTTYASPAALNAAYPDGTYKLSWQLDTGAFGSSTMPLTADSYPPIPQIINFSQTQNLDPDSGFVLQYAPFAGATANDFVAFSITDKSGSVFQDPDPCVPRTLSSTETSLTIPKGTLSSGKLYQATLSFIRVTTRDTTSMASAVGTASISKTLHFNIQTSGTARPAGPQFTQFKRLPDGSFQIHFSGQPNVNYEIDFSTDLITWDWLISSNSVSGVINFIDTSSMSGGQGFYRAQTAE